MKRYQHYARLSHQLALDDTRWPRLTHILGYLAQNERRQRLLTFQAPPLRLKAKISRWTKFKRFLNQFRP